MRMKDAARASRNGPQRRRPAVRARKGRQAGWPRVRPARDLAAPR